MSSSSIRDDFVHVASGFCMGGADIVPGVSGGTVALVLGIYQRLVTAISHFDLRLLAYLRMGEVRQAAKHVDLRFLAALATGIAGGFLTMSVLMNRLLTNDLTRSLTLAAFFGLIVGSAIVVASMVKPSTRGRTISSLAFGLLGAILAYWLTTLTGTSHDPSYGYVFLCGCLAICAMILPGISGAMVLLLLGIYVHLTEIPRNLLHGEQVVEGLTTSVVFVSGAAISLVLFSKLLRWLLEHYHMLTMSVLCGFMVGALPKIWPFQVDQTPEIEEFRYKRFAAVLPDAIDAQVIFVFAIVLLTAIAVVVVERYSARKGTELSWN